MPHNARMTTHVRLAIVLAIIGALAAVGAALLPASSAGTGCGSWVAPEWSRAESRAIVDNALATSERARKLGAHELAGRARAIGAHALEAYAGCDETLGRRRAVSLGALGLGVASSAGVVFVGAGRRREP